MNIKAVWGTLLAALLGTALAGAAEPKLGKFVAYDTGKFTIVTSRGEKQVSDLMGDLAQFQRTLEVTLRRTAADTGNATHIFILGHSEWQRYLQPNEGVAGLFVPRRFANFMFIDGDSERMQALRIVFHEYTHFFLRSQFSGEYPPWFNEGMAEFLSMASFKDGTTTFGIPVQRVLDARASAWIPFDRLLRLDQNSPEYQTHTLARGFYGQSWLTVQYGMLANREFGKQMYAYLNELNRLVPVEEAARTTFGTNLAAIDKQLFEYSRRSSLSQIGIKVGAAPPLVLGAGRPLSDTDALAMVADLMLELRLAPDRIRPLVSAVGAREPNSPRGVLLKARLADFEDDDAQFERTLEFLVPMLAADDWRSRKELAVVLLERASDGGLGRRSIEQTEADLERAMKWFDEALAHNSDDVETLWGYGTAAATLRKNLDLAEKRLKVAYDKAPTNADIAMSLAHVYSSKGDPKQMIPLLEDVIRYATQLPMRQWANDTLDQAQAFIAEQERVAAENKKARERWEQEVEKKRKAREREDR